MKTSEKIAFVGAGAMGGALMRGFLKAKLARPKDILASDADKEKLAALAKQLGISPAASNIEAAEASAIIFLAVKPGLTAAVMGEIAPHLRSGQILISIAAGINLARLRSLLKSGKPNLVRVMPNTPALVGQGLSAIAFDAGIKKSVKEKVIQLFRAVGEAIEVDEKQMDAVTGLSGSGPAYVFVAIEALADGGVAAGLPRSIAQVLAIQTVLGAAALLKQTGMHPAAAKDMVVSPGGTTSAGLAALEESAFRASLIQAVLLATERSRELSG
jgi:pyrroline-5-carboxylate reductase